MKKVAFIIVLIFLSVYSFAQKVIQMENTNGVYRISCSVNGAKMKMIFDTGASTVSLSETMANFLYDNGYISKEDVLGTSTSQTADGSIHNNVVINLKDIEISGLHLKNVLATVISSQNAPLLLGQTAIQKLGRISLNGDKLIIYDYDGDYTEEELDKIADEAEDFYNKGSYHAAIESLLKYMDYGDLTTYGYCVLTECLLMTKQYEKCIKYGKEWEIKYRNEPPSFESTLILDRIATSLDVGEEKTKEALIYYEKCAAIESKLGYNPCLSYAQIAMSHWSLKDYDSAINYSKKALNGMLKKYNTSVDEINKRGIDNSNIGGTLYWYALSLYGKKDNSSGDYIMGLAAKCNYEAAIRYCYENNIQYKSRQSLFE
ncbi:MAG: retroviral-like aspartic protease family protein [Prevotella sp.]|nr:retroviral-like aspartic protease family protein [Prevotella sp.]